VPENAVKSNRESSEEAVTLHNKMYHCDGMPNLKDHEKSLMIPSWI
jgi:hypothetical protein